MNNRVPLILACAAAALAPPLAARAQSNESAAAGSPPSWHSPSLVDETAVLCDAIHEEFLAPSIESLRARVRHNDKLAARRQIRAQSQVQAQS